MSFFTYQSQGLLSDFLLRIDVNHALMVERELLLREREQSC